MISSPRLPMSERHATVVGDAGRVEAWLYSLIRADAPRGADAHAASVALFDELGNPQDDRPAIHVVGTAGKGSVAASITAGLMAAGERVATHYSPHAYDLRERFTIDGVLPPWVDVIAAAGEVADAASRLEQPPTFFAATTAIAIELGRMAGVDRFVIEAGIGGRVDATNVMSRADVITVVTAIGLDHTDVLGTTVSEIAAEKAAVVRGRRHVVLGPQPDSEAIDVVYRVAGQNSVEVLDVEPTGDIRLDARATASVALGLLGYTVAEVPARLAGRFESHDIAGRRVVFDGAHNPMKLGALAETLPETAAVVVAAVGSNKPLTECAAILAAMGEVLIVTTFGPPVGEPGPRSWSMGELSGALLAAGAGRVLEATGAELAAAVENESEPGDLVVVTGSFLHLGDVRERLTASHV